MTVEYSARSHVGKVRENNEDNLYVDGIILASDVRERPFTIDGITNLPTIFAVCDGMGGEDDGEIASLLAVQTLLNYERKIKTARPKQLNETIQSYVDEISESIRSETDKSGKRTGTTLALVVVAKNGLFCFNIGDSRIYCYQKAELKQITNDHTLIAEKIKNGIIEASQAAGVAGGNKLTRCIGIGNNSNTESYPTITGKCRALICSDGLTDMVNPAEIENILRESERTANAADYLLDTALRFGGKDNTTVIVIDVEVPKVPFLHGLTKILKG
jgi:protein phosphatase